MHVGNAPRIVGSSNQRMRLTTTLAEMGRNSEALNGRLLEECGSLRTSATVTFAGCARAQSANHHLDPLPLLRQPRTFSAG